MVPVTTKHTMGGHGTLVGDAEDFLTRELKPEALVTAAANPFPLELRMQSGYDPSGYFIASAIEVQLRFHAGHLARV